MPEEINGALIFRTGFIEGVNWLKSGTTVDSVFILSQRSENLKMYKNFSVQKINDVSFIGDRSVKHHLRKTDVLFHYTDSSLQVLSQ